MKFKINKHLIIQKIDKDLVVFNPNKSYLYALNETAEFVLKKIKRGWGENMIIIELRKKYEVAAPILQKDVQTIIKDMIKHKIIIPINVAREKK
jgi:hypothetical protein